MIFAGTIGVVGYSTEYGEVVLDYGSQASKDVSTVHYLPTYHHLYLHVHLYM